MRGVLAAAILLAILLAGLGTPGCATYRAAQLYGSGSDALDRGEVSQAVDDLEQAAALAPQASEVQNHLGLAYAAAGRDGDALAAFERAVALDCDNAAAHENLAAATQRARAKASP